jgi:hypothetical protein
MAEKGRVQEKAFLPPLRDGGRLAGWRKLLSKGKESR